MKLFTHLRLWMALFHQCFVALDVYFEKLHNKWPYVVMCCTRTEFLPLLGTLCAVVMAHACIAVGLAINFFNLIMISSKLKMWPLTPVVVESLDFLFQDDNCFETYMQQCDIMLVSWLWHPGGTVYHTASWQ